jgi:hypothetical protein
MRLPDFMACSLRPAAQPDQSTTSSSNLEAAWAKRNEQDGYRVTQWLKNVQICVQSMCWWEQCTQQQQQQLHTM